MKMMTTSAPAFSFLPLRWKELAFAGAQALSPYLLAWLMLAVTQA